MNYKIDDFVLNSFILSYNTRFKTNLSLADLKNALYHLLFVNDTSLEDSIKITCYFLAKGDKKNGI